MIAHLLLTLFALFATWSDNPAPEPVPAVAPAPRPVVTPGERPTTPHHAPPAPVRAPTADDPVCEPDTPPGVVCVQGQLPAETTGRAIG